MNYKTLFKFGSWATIATGIIHSLSFLNEPQPQNDSERQLFDLLANYRFDLGGTMRSMEELMNFFSLGMTFLCLFAGILNLMLLKHFDNDAALAKKIVGFNAIAWTLYLIPLYLLTFLPPQVCFTVAWAGYAAAFWLLRKTGS
jgi:hypothetical protein